MASTSTFAPKQMGDATAITITATATTNVNGKNESKATNGNVSIRGG